MTASKCSNGNPGCLRGFVREKCHKCQMGSTACNMCHTNLSSLVAQHSQPSQTTGTSPSSSSCTQHNRFSSSSSTSSSSSSTSSCSTSSAPSPDSSPRNSVSVDTSSPNSRPRAAVPLTVKTLSISYQLPLPSGHPQRSLVSNSPTIPSPSRDFSISVLALPTPLHPVTAFGSSSSSSQPSSPTSSTTPITHVLPSPSSPSFPNNPDPSPYAQYGPSSPCIFCFNGRKACEECFGLGYVQRICQDCLRDKHKSQRRRNSHSAHSGTSSSSSSSKSLINPTAVSASWIQFSHKLKEQFSFGHHQQQQQQQQQQHHHEVDSRRDVQRKDNSNSKGKDKNRQIRKDKEQRSKSMISLPLVRTLSLTRASSTTSVHQPPQTSSPSSPTLGPVHEEELLGDSQGTALERVNSLSSSNETSGGGVPVSRAKKSFKATVLSALKVPSLFHTSENPGGPSRNSRTSTNTGTGATRTGTTARQPHRRQWSLPSLSTIGLPAASTAA